MEEEDTVSPVQDWKDDIKNEIKQLRADIMATKKSVSKGDKKAKKEVQAKIEELEAQIAAKQTLLASDVDPNGSQQTDEAAASGEPALQLYQEQTKGKKQTKKDKKAASAAARVQALRSVPKGPDLSALEQRKLEELLKSERLEIYDIEPDGHCMFAAVAHQLGVLFGETCEYSDLRRLAANYIQENGDFYAAFIDEDEDAEAQSDKLAAYCERIRSTSLWGGHVELDALAKALQKTIVVYQADGEPLRFGESSPETPLKLLFLRHAYSLGEHYDSLLPFKN